MSDLFDPIAATESGHPALDRWNTIINACAVKYGVPANLVKATILHESGGDATVVSGDGGFGLMQITSGVVGGKFDGLDMLDPASNVIIGCRSFIAPNMVEFPGNLDAVIAAYNAGVGAVFSALRTGRDLTSVTYAPWYIPAVRSSYDWLNQQSHKELGT